MGNRAKGIFGSLPILAAAFGGRQGIEVRIGGKDASTDGKSVIHLPTLPLECDERLEIEAMGYLYHETGHIEFTDFQVLENVDTPLHGLLLNVLEDVRMEAMRNASYPGSARSLEKLIELIAKDGEFGTPEEVAEAEPQDVLVRGVLTRLRSRVLRQPVGGVEDLWWSKLVNLLGKAATIKLEVLLGQVAMLDATEDALALAGRIKTVIEDAANEPEPPLDQPDGGEGSAESAVVPGGSASGAGPSDGDIDGASPAENGAAGASSGHNDDVVPNGMSSLGAGHHGAPDQDQGPDRAALRKALGAATGDFKASDLGQVLARRLAKDAKEALERSEPSQRSQSVNAGLRVSKRVADGEGELSEVLGHSQQLRTRLAAAMEAKAREKVTHRRNGSRLDGRKVHRLFTGDTRLFIRRDHKVKVNTAVQILLDRSSSMSGKQIVVARQAALAASVGVGQIHGCKVAAAAFPEIEVLKDFDEQSRGAAGRFAVEATGGTPLGRAMIWAASQLVVRKEVRKMLIVVTDGQPDDIAQVKHLVRMYQQSGVEIVGVGINCLSVGDLYPVSVVIHSVDELANALFGVLSQRMRRVA